MIWHKNLYVSEKTSRESIRQFGKMRTRFSFPAYMITFPANSENLLDIISASQITSNPYYKDTIIVGIANGKKDALELVRDIIWDTYKNTGKFDVKSYIEEKL